MKISHFIPSCNRVGVITSTGNIVPAAFSSAWNFSSVTEDIYLESMEGKPVSFLIVPMAEGTINVELDSGLRYTIQAAETKASIGLPMKYLVRRILKDGTSVTSLTIGI